MVTDTGVEMSARVGTIIWFDLIEGLVSLANCPSSNADHSGTTFSAYCDGLLDVGYSRLPSQDANHDVCHRISAHENLLHNGREVLQSLSKDPRILKSANPTLFHPDLHMRNIFVSEDDPTIITGFIDWQSSSIEPAIEYTDDVPDFAAPTFESAEGKEEDQRSTDIICRTAVDACLHGLIPKLSYARSINGILLQPFRFCHRTWLDGPAAFREQLIQLAKSWTDVGMQGACPYEIPGPDALRDQASDYQALLTARGVSQQVINLLQVPSDGWVPVSDYKAKLRDNQEAFRMFLDVMKETPSASGKASSELEDDLRQIWPFDVGSDTSG